MLEPEKIKFDENGLVPCVVQDYRTKKVLTLAYMNAESLAITLDKKLMCFYSRSRRTLWLKGETSGNYQHLVSLTADCDRDCLVAEVIKDGPACHKGDDGCFNESVFGEKSDFSTGGLYNLLTERNALRPEGSYTTYLFEKGREKILKKVGEESAEVLIAATKNDRAETIYELADLCYHALVLMTEMNITPEEVRAELASRHIVDKKVKQETMQ